MPLQHLNRRLQLRHMLAVVVNLYPWADRCALDNPAPAVCLQGPDSILNLLLFRRQQSMRRRDFRRCGGDAKFYRHGRIEMG